MSTAICKSMSIDASGRVWLTTRDSNVVPSDYHRWAIDEDDTGLALEIIGANLWGKTLVFLPSSRCKAARVYRSVLARLGDFTSFTSHYGPFSFESDEERQRFYKEHNRKRHEFARAFVEEMGYI